MSNVPPFLANKSGSPLMGQKSQDHNTNVVIKNAVFFPDIQLLDFQTRFRVDGSQMEERQIQALTWALFEVNAVLTDDSIESKGKGSWVYQMLNKGYDELKQVSGNDLGDCSEKITLYLTAVYSKAKATLIATYPELFFGKKDKSAKADADINTVEFYENQMRNALNKLLGRTAFSACLI